MDFTLNFSFVTSFDVLNAFSPIIFTLFGNCSFASDLSPIYPSLRTTIPSVIFALPSLSNSFASDFLQRIFDFHKSFIDFTSKSFDFILTCMFVFFRQFFPVYIVFQYFFAITSVTFFKDDGNIIFSISPQPLYISSSLNLSMASLAV